MRYLTRVQVIERGNGTHQYYLILPSPLAHALEMEKGEKIEWVTVVGNGHATDPAEQEGL